MPHCTSCGTEVPGEARFCPKCGQSQPAASFGSATAPAPAPATQSGLSENAAALLSYVLGWITGIIFFVIDQRPYVRFHAMQSIVTFGGLHIIRIVLGIFLGVGWWYGGFGTFGLAAMIVCLLGLLTFVLWIVCMIKAYQGVRFKVPIAGDVAESVLSR